MGYARERKEAILKKMLPPSNKTIKELAQEEGICEATLYHCLPPVVQRRLAGGRDLRGDAVPLAEGGESRRSLAAGRR